MRVIIIGGIAAGMSVAAKASRTNPNAKITIIEKEDYVSFGACGLPYYIGGQFEDENEMYARTPDQMRAAGIEVLLKHEATNIDFKRKNVTVLNYETKSEDTLEYDRLMIATGASAIMPPISGIESDNVYTITKPYDGNKFKDNLKSMNDVVIIGGGFIGIEMAEQLAHLGKNVHIIEAQDTLISGPFDKEIADKIKESLETIGVKVHLSQTAKSFKTQNNLVVSVETNDEVIKADSVIISVGFRPNTALVKDQLNMLSNGAIITDNYGETSIKDVFAAGDCAAVNHRIGEVRYSPLATYANKMGRLIGTNIVTDKEEWLSFSGALGSGAIKVGEFEAGSTGITEKSAETLGINYKTTLVYTNNHSNYYTDVAQEKIMIKLIYHADTKVLLGAQVFGRNETVLRLHALTTAIHAELTTDEIGFIDYAYAPPFASTWEAINVAANTAK